ncbi:MAG: glycosyltransferase [Bacteroidaceae bacterium]|nr:glycosyltransferase [Bacteroidaceae bacterium]
MAQPLFSIITITFNAATTLPATLRSVEEQTFTNYEYIVVDGASRDNTVALVEASQLPVRMVSEPDKGLYDAMNKGLKMATGEYLIFLNAGDSFHAPDTLQRVAEAIGNNRPGVVYGETAIVDANRNFLMMRRLQAPEKLSWRSFKQGMLVCHQAFIARRDIAPLYDLKYRYSADVDWCIRCMKQTDELLNTHLTLIDYLNEGETTRHHRASLKERFAVMCHHYGTISTALRHIGFALRYAIARAQGRA